MQFLELANDFTHFITATPLFERLSLVRERRGGVVRAPLSRPWDGVVAAPVALPPDSPGEAPVGLEVDDVRIPRRRAEGYLGFSCK